MSAKSLTTWGWRIFAASLGAAIVVFPFVTGAAYAQQTPTVSGAPLHQSTAPPVIGTLQELRDAPRVPSDEHAEAVLDLCSMFMNTHDDPSWHDDTPTDASAAQSDGTVGFENYRADLQVCTDSPPAFAEEWLRNHPGDQ